MNNDEMFQGIDDRIFNNPIYAEEEEEIIDHEQDHPSIKGEDE